MDKMLNNILEVVIGVMFITAFGLSVVNNTDTRKCGTVVSAAYNLSVCPLENASTMSKSFFGIIELLYPVMGIGLIVDGIRRFMKK